MTMRISDIIYFSERNIHGAWVLYGILGIRQYYGYGLEETKEKYVNEAKGKVFFNEKPKKETKK